MYKSSVGKDSPPPQTLLRARKETKEKKNDVGNGEIGRGSEH